MSSTVANYAKTRAEMFLKDFARVIEDSSRARAEIQTALIQELSAAMQLGMILSWPQIDEKHPMQSIELAGDGQVRFRENKIIRQLIIEGKLDLNEIAMRAVSGEFDAADRMQISQLSGYSVTGFCDLNFVTDEVRETVLGLAENVLDQPGETEEENKDGEK